MVKFSFILTCVTIILTAFVPAYFVYPRWSDLLTQGPCAEIRAEVFSSRPDQRGQYCGLPTAEIEEYLKLPHSSEPFKERYLALGAWRTISDLQELLAGMQEEFVCVVVSIEKDVPCPRGSCLLALNLRPRTSDANVALQLFDKDEYSFMKKYNPRTLLDAGANVGLASLIFGTMWPEARIIAVEASSSNYRALQRNVKHLANVTPVHAGLWWKLAKLKLIKGNRAHPQQEWQFMVEEVDEATPPEALEGSDVFTGVTVDFLLEFFNLPAFDVAKIDIEGSEKDVFTLSPLNRLSWVSKTQVLAIEIHDDMKAGAQATVVNGISTVVGQGVSVVMQGEYAVFENKAINGSIIATQRRLVSTLF